MKALTKPKKKRKQAASTIVKTLHGETTVVAKPLSKVDIKNIPNVAEPAIKNWIGKQKQHEVYGSGAMATHSIHARRPADLDLVISNPRGAATALSNILRKHEIKTKIVGNPEWGSYVVQICKNGEWVDALDIHPIKGHRGRYEFYGSSKAPLNKRGINIQRASDQLLRKANSITQRNKEGRMGAAPHRELKDTQDFIQTAEVLVASMEAKTKAEQAKVKKVREAIKVWEAHLRTLEGGKKKIAKEKAISKTRVAKFVREAVKKPAMNIDDLIFENGEVTERKLSISKTKKKAKSPYAKQPHKKKGAFKAKAKAKVKAKVPKVKKSKKRKKKKLVDVPGIISFDEVMKMLR